MGEFGTFGQIFEGKTFEKDMEMGEGWRGTESSILGIFRHSLSIVGKN